MTRVFLDANILFSAAWREGGGVSALWEKEGLQLVSSPYALQEAERNLQAKKPVAMGRLATLARKVEVSSARTALADDFGLPEKDRPILEAAVGSGCSVLLTGDITHFGHLIGAETQGVEILTVSLFLQRWQETAQADEDKAT